MPRVWVGLACDLQGAGRAGSRKGVPNFGWRTTVSIPTRRVLKPRPAWTRQFDEAVACATDEGAANSADARSWLARELNARRERWIARRPVDAWTIRGVLLGLSIASTSVVVVAFVSGAIMNILGAVVICAFGPLSFACCVVTVAAFICDLPERPAVRRYANRCPKCGDGLLGTPSAVDPSLLGGEKIGPRTCPKCGSAWPLVRPPN